MSRTASEKLLWHEWTPGLDNDDWTLDYVLSTMPGAAPSDIPLWIRIFENPSSPFAFPGAISLAGHDAVHVLLGRGLMPQDEAFVIGFTMGADTALKDWQGHMFGWIAHTLYRPPYRFGWKDLVAYRLGVWEGRIQPCENIHKADFNALRALPLAEVRTRLGICRNRLYSVYAYEKSLLPDTKASRRLDIDLKKLDPSALLRPGDGEKEGAGETR